jgi:hypothetical protein
MGECDRKHGVAMSRPYDDPNLVEQRANATIVNGTYYEPHEYVQASLALLVAILKELRKQKQES